MKAHSAFLLAFSLAGACARPPAALKTSAQAPGPQPCTPCSDSAEAAAPSRGPMQSEGETESSFELVLAKDVEWNHLNPARGDKAPQAATLWGDRNGKGATGFLLKPADGFSSPPHIHNVSYRGVVLSGLIHNDDPHAETTWMPAGSFWTQPQGQVHITSAQGANVLAYIEIEEGPYLVHPTEKKFDSGERPVNVDASNITWVDASRLAFVESESQLRGKEGPQVSFLWEAEGKDAARGYLFRLPKGFDGELASKGPSFQAIVIAGAPELQTGAPVTWQTLEKGSYFRSTGPWRHRLRVPEAEPGVLYVRSKGEFRIAGERRGSARRED